MVDQEETKDDTEMSANKQTAQSANGNSSEFQSASINPKQVFVTDEELKAMQKEAIEYKDKYLRLLADAENARKRLQKERQEITRYAVESLVVDFLHPLDNLENALKFAQDMSDEVKNWAFGFQMILAQFKDVLANNGVVAVESQGMQFDPHLHEAVEMIETTSYIPGTIVEESVRGYKMGDRTIRPARVKVAKTATPKESQEKIDENN
ncbi:Heat shock protein GrpE [Candidatus Protochlamydia naegleriophila]|uniref:Protein GrpE n=1 Tax=Candidatus Protochlamydia naegleriophila TaxID=389348 RepID=A0A0U5JDJ1_9BACT|nr:nucleotide exchange factor GrpE [Candidatus Protochlamydia naegleriophila]CUI15941.1 Heat shock protein GrpE [Candidatus Protochlamydia naegleriophila]